MSLTINNVLLPTRTAIIYCRISSKSQSLSSLEFQKTYCQEYANKYNLDVKEIIKEISSAYSKQTPKLKELISRISDCILLVYSISRFSRNTEFSLSLINEMRKKNIYLVSVSENIFVNNSFTRHLFRILVSDAEYQSDVNSERVRMSKKRKLDNTLINISKKRRLDKNEINT